MSKNQNKKKELDEEFEQIQKQYSNTTDMSKYLVDSDEDMPGFGEVQLYDYDKDINKAKATGKKLLRDLVDLYLGDSTISDHPYIQSRMDEDAEYYSQMKIVQKMSEKLLLQQMRQIDAGEISTRMYEITTKQLAEMRENIKDGRNARLEIEKMYKAMRKDLGLNETVKNDSYQIDDEDEEGGHILNSSDINTRIEELMKGQNDKNED